jgi:hypothetical protein
VRQRAFAAPRTGTGSGREPSSPPVSIRPEAAVLPRPLVCCRSVSGERPHYPGTSGWCSGCSARLHGCWRSTRPGRSPRRLQRREVQLCCLSGLFSNEVAEPVLPCRPRGAAARSNPSTMSGQPSAARRVDIHTARRRSRLPRRSPQSCRGHRGSADGGAQAADARNIVQGNKEDQCKRL